MIWSYYLMNKDKLADIAEHSAFFTLWGVVGNILFDNIMISDEYILAVLMFCFGLGWCVGIILDYLGYFG